ncbi:MAG: hypothetical protein ACOZAA_02245 [Pseudomonadota bacterium]
MTIGDLLAAGFRNAFIVIGFVCIFIGLITRETNPGNRGLGMALVVVGALMIVVSAVGRSFGLW